MKQIFKNSAIMGLLSSTFFQILGISLFNMILLILAKSSTDNSLWVTIVSITATLPGIFSALLGKLAGNLINKINWIILLTFSQSIMYIFLSFIFFNSNDKLILVIAITINLISDIIGVIIGLLKLTIIQNKVPSTLRQQTLGIYQSISLIMQPIGQALGLYYIMTTNNYVIGSIINSITFCLSGFILLLFKQQLSYISTITTKSKIVNKDNTYKKALSLLGNVTQLPILNIMLTLIILNILGASIDGILNLYILNNTQISPFGFGISILIINLVFVFGNVLGSIIINDIFKSFSFKNLVLLESVLLFIFYMILILNLNIFYVSSSLFMITYVLGKINPKLYALLMDNIDSSSLTTILGIINSSLTVAAPIGSILLVGGYTLIGKNSIIIFSMVLIICVLTLMSLKIKK
ncbi:MFS transporter [Periweissella fabalis]|uniref:MFS transporter n=1 Tax=Periweissella fabalis TaxID=1070421 RepID=A0A7X6S3D5_9LACO|nr:MFS transporter [Periweissella fabalis]MCM0598444.1 hypothetical protein [Periweissella fabalis]NKZ25009.1 MFS transporter [Periweissella fabalis]